MKQAGYLKPGGAYMCLLLPGTYDAVWQLFIWFSSPGWAFQLCIPILQYSNWPILQILHKYKLTKFITKFTGFHLSHPVWVQI